MIERIVLFKLRNEHATPEQRDEIARETRSRLARCAGVRGISVGMPADEATEKSWDLSVVLHFHALDDVDAFLQDVAQRDYLDDFMAPRMEVVKAWNFKSA